VFLRHSLQRKRTCLTTTPVLPAAPSIILSGSSLASAEAKLSHTPLIKSRCESIVADDVFWLPYRSSRCLVPVNGFFEWEVLGTGKSNPKLAP
jgi:putative SOS response-associated peptidase YedK